MSIVRRFDCPKSDSPTANLTLTLVLADYLTFGLWNIWTIEQPPSRDQDDH